jgi:hypothetical protein
MSHLQYGLNTYIVGFSHDDFNLHHWLYSSLTVLQYARSYLCGHFGRIRMPSTQGQNHMTFVFTCTMTIPFGRSRRTSCREYRCEYESGINDATGAVLSKMADALQISVDYLLGKSDDPSPILRESTLSAKEQQVLLSWRRGQHMRAVKIIVDDDPCQSGSLSELGRLLPLCLCLTLRVSFLEKSSTQAYERPTLERLSGV